MEKFIRKLAEGAGDILMKRFGKIRSQKTKQHSLDLVTAADLESNRFISREIKKKFPEHGIISEELKEHRKGSEWTWIVDPLDGTGNYANGIPIFTVLIALVRKNQVEYGTIYDPAHKECFFAQRGKGAFLNGRRISTSKTKKLADSVGSNNTWLRKSALRVLQKLIDSRSKDLLVVTGYGSSGFNAVQLAAGRKEWMMSTDSKVWDYAASAIILREAGCLVTDFSGKSWTLDKKQFLAANPQLHKQLIRIINK